MNLNTETAVGLVKVPERVSGHWARANRSDASLDFVTDVAAGVGGVEATRELASKLQNMMRRLGDDLRVADYQPVDKATVETVLEDAAFLLTEMQAAVLRARGQVDRS